LEEMARFIGQRITGENMNTSSNLPETRADGRCVDCQHKPAVTTDRRFCLKCLRVRIRNDNHIDRKKPFSGAMRGYKARSTDVLGGCPKMPGDESDQD
jgi:hypothetical protein